MGRRSISSTKAGKFMNPTDQARKEARRKELKKNKKQRQQVREAVIKQKDPKHLLNDMELLDKLEFDINNPPPYSAKVIQDKRKKLKDQWVKIYQFYQKEDPKVAYELKQQEIDYERRHQLMAGYYESIMQAQRVKLDDIPLPSDEPSVLNTPYMGIEMASSGFMPPMSLIPPLMPPPPPPPVVGTIVEISAPPTATKSILKSSGSSSSLANQSPLKAKKLPGIPPGPPPSSPPDLNEFECDDDEKELGLTLDDPYKSTDKVKKIRFSSQPAPSATEVSKKPVVTIAPPQPPPMPSIAPVIPASTAVKYGAKPAQPPPPPPPPTQPYLQSRPQQQPQQQQQQRQYYQSYGQQQTTQSHQHQQQSSSSSQASSSAATTTIEAKPVLRNKVAELTRFVPTTLMVKRDSKPTGSKLVSSSNRDQSSYYNTNQSQQSMSRTQPFNYMSQQQQQYATLNPLNLSGNSNIASSLKSSLSNRQQHHQQYEQQAQQTSSKMTSTDAAYESFMNEMKELL